MVNLGTLPGGSQSYSSAVSADGRVIVGYSNTKTGNFHAFRWTEDKGIVDLDTLPGGSYSQANAVSADGNFVVGSSATGGGGAYSFSHAVLWTQDGDIVDLGTLPGDYESYATGVSANGSIVVGGSYIPDEIDGGWRDGHAFRWTKGEGMVDLGKLNNGPEASPAGVSADGKVVVGDAIDHKQNIRAFRWKQETGMVDIASLSAFTSIHASGVSTDGNVVVGTGDISDYSILLPHQAYRWTQATGIQTINQWLAANGTDASGVDFSIANAVSADGYIVVGTLGNYHAFLARVFVPRPADCLPLIQLLLDND